MDDCIFCKIGRGEVPSYKIHEDDKFLAFLDRNPNENGHTLIIPKQHFRFVWDVDNIGAYFEFCQKVAKHFQKVTNNEFVYSIVHGEAVAHAHVHLIPNNGGDYGKKLSEFAATVKVGDLTPEKAEEIVNQFKF